MPLNALYAQLRNLQLRLLGLPIGGTAYQALLAQINAHQALITQAEQGVRDWSRGL